MSRNSIRTVLDFHFKHHRHGFVMPHKEHVPKFHYHGMYVGAEPSAKLTPTELYHEADKRFWATTKYKIGLTLNPQDPLDRPYIKQWNNIYQKVLSDYKKGTLVVVPADWQGIVNRYNPNNAANVPITTPTPEQIKHADSIINSVESQFTKQPIPLAEVHQEQAELHQVQADDHKQQAAEHAAQAVVEANAGNQAKAEEHVDISNQHNEKAEVHQKQVEIHSSIASSLKDAKSYAQNEANNNPSSFIGVKIFNNGLTTTFPFNSRDELDTWYGSTSDEDIAEGQKTGAWKVQYVGGFDKNDSAWPDAVFEHGASIMQIPVTSHPPIQTPAPQAPMSDNISDVASNKQGSGGAAVGFMLALGGGLLLATGAAKGKR